MVKLFCFLCAGGSSSFPFSSLDSPSPQLSLCPSLNNSDVCKVADGGGGKGHVEEEQQGKQQHEGSGGDMSVAEEIIQYMPIPAPAL
jgi:hypothetical protein